MMCKRMLHMLSQFGKTFWLPCVCTVVLVISHFSLTRFPDASESKSWFSVTQPRTSTTVVPVATVDVATTTTVLPPVSTVLSTLPSHSANDALTSRLPVTAFGSLPGAPSCSAATTVNIAANVDLTVSLKEMRLIPAREIRVGYSDVFVWSDLFLRCQLFYLYCLFNRVKVPICFGSCCWFCDASQTC